MDLVIFWTILKLMMFALLSFVIYLMYIIFYIPLKVRSKYSKYKNVYMAPKFVPIAGDMMNHLNDEKAGKVHYHHKKELANVIKDYDLKLQMEGITPYILVISSQATKEFVQNQPLKIDKSLKKKGFFKMFEGSFGGEPTTEKTKLRRKLFTSLLGLNSSSKYIPTIIDCCDVALKDLKPGDVSFQHAMNTLTFNSFSRILFGKDLEQLINKPIPFVKSDGSIEQVSMVESFIRTGKDYLEEYYSPLASMFPILSSKGLYKQFGINDKNFDTFKNAMRNMLKETKDKDSVLYQIRESGEFSEDEIFHDLILFMVGGTESSSHSLTAAFYYLKKYPDILAKVKKELEEYDIKKGSGLKDAISFDSINKLEYVTNFVKEVLRYDTVVSDTFDYRANQDVTICGVPISKGTMMKIDILTAHHNDATWMDPFAFEPDRFDAESEFYAEAKKQSKSSDSYSRRSFSFGLRNCPGQSFAMLQIKVIISYLSVLLNYDIDEATLNKEGIGFGLGSKEPSVFRIL
jgi:cytochrome P450